MEKRVVNTISSAVIMIKQFQWIMKQSRLGVYSHIKKWTPVSHESVGVIHCMYTSLGICMAMSKSLSTKSSGLLNHLDQYKWAWYPLFAHVFNRHKIPWLPDTIMYRPCHDDVDVMISLLFYNGYLCLTLWAFHYLRPPAPWIQNNDSQTTAENVCEVRVRGIDVFLWFL